MARSESGHTTSEASGLFARSATGLVRGVSPRSSLVINVIPGHPAQSLAAGFFFVFALFPGGNYLLGLLMVIPMVLAMSYAFGLLTSMIPRSGGDYMLVSRVIHPLVGLISSFCMTLAGLLSNAFFGIAFVTIGLGPGLIAIGLIDGNTTLVDWGNTISTSNGWKFALGAGMMVLAGLVLAGGWQRTLRIQNVVFWIVSGGLLLCVLAALFTSKSDFIANFNHFAERYTHKPDSYHDIIATAQKSGVDTSPSFSFGNTIPITGFFALFSIYSYWSTFVGGELRQASTIRTARNMAIAGTGAILVVAVFAAIFFRSFGTPFMIAANGGGMPPAIATAPTFFFLMSASVGSTIFAVVAVFAYVLYWPLITYVSFIQPTRMLFAYSFDGLLPKAVTRTTRGGAPWVAIIAAVLMSWVALLWAINQSTFIQVLTYAALIQLIAMGLVGLAAVVVPYTKPEFFRASASQLRIGGVPIVTLAGLGSILTAAIIWFMYFHYAPFGLANKTKFFEITGGTIVLAILFYLVAKTVRRRQGVDIDLAYAEIPPE